MSAKESFNEKAVRPIENINTPNRHGTNKLIEAIEKGKAELVQAMVEQDADIGFRTLEQTRLSSVTHKVPYSKNSTPLHVACLHGSPLIIEILLDKRAEVNAKNDAGYTPLDYALLSYAYYKSEHEKKADSRFTLQRSIDKSFSRVEEYASVIKKMTEAGGKPGLFILPREFMTEQAIPAQKNNLPAAGT